MPRGGGAGAGAGAGASGAVSPSLLPSARRMLCSAPPSPITKPTKPTKTPKPTKPPKRPAVALSMSSGSEMDESDDEELRVAATAAAASPSRSPSPSQSPSPTLSPSLTAGSVFQAPRQPAPDAAHAVQRHEHPLGTGAPGAWYNPYDRVTPIIDAMNRLYRSTLSEECCFGIFDKPRPSSQQQAAAAQRDRDRAAAAEHRASTNGWVCVCCGNTNANSLANARLPRVSVRRDTRSRSRRTAKACAAEDDATQHADAPVPTSSRNPAVPDCTRKRPETAEERRAARLRAVRGTVPGSRAKGGLAHAQSQVERDAARVAADHAVEMGELTQREQIKVAKILNIVVDLCTALAPVEEAIATRIKTSAFDTYRDAVRHERACGEACQMQLAPRSAVTIAAAIFELEVQRMLHEGGTTDRQRLLELADRMARSTAFSTAASATQRASARATMELMRAPDWCHCKPCAPYTAPPAQTAARSPGHASPLGEGGVSGVRGVSSLERLMVRSASLASDCTTTTADAAECEASPQGVPAVVVRVRDAIAQVFPQVSAEMPIATSEGALRRSRPRPCEARCSATGACTRSRPSRRRSRCCLRCTAAARRTVLWAAGCSPPGLAWPMPRCANGGRAGAARARKVATESEADEDDLFS